MPTNDFKEVATGGGANVELQATYVADPVLPIGFGVNAVPPSALWNKMMRQSSVIARMVAQAICDLTGNNMLDDGNAATQLANFKTMLAASGVVAQSLASPSGYVKFGSGLILQWTKITSPAGAGSSASMPAGMNWYLYGDITWPIAFPTACVWCYGDPETTNDTYFWLFQGLKAVNKWGTVYITRNTNGVIMLATDLYIFALGY